MRPPHTIQVEIDKNWQRVNIYESNRRTYAVDVSGGVEASKGIKQFTLLQAFMAGVNAA